MKKSFTMLSMLCSLSLFAGSKDPKKGPNRAEFSGSGYVINTADNGAKIEYRANLVVKWDENGTKTIFSRVETDKEVYNYSKTLVPGDFNTFVVNNASGPIGTGYCVEKTLSTICHMDAKIEGKDLEETVHIGVRSVDRMGSVRDENGRKYWTDSLHKVHHAKK